MDLLLLESRDPVGHKLAVLRRAVVAEVLRIFQLAVVKCAVTNLVGDAELFRTYTLDEDPTSA